MSFTKFIEFNSYNTNCTNTILLHRICIYVFLHSHDYTSLPHYGAQDDDDDEFPNNTCQKSLESLFETLTTPSKDSDTHDISRFENNTLTYLSPATTRLHKELCGNSYEKIGGRSTMSLRTSRKSMLENIDWMIEYGMIEENAEAAKFFNEMEKFVQKSKLKLQNNILMEKNRGKQQGRLEFAAYDAKKKKPEPRLKGIAG